MIRSFFDKEIPNILIFSEIDSTSAEIKRMLEQDTAEEGLIIWAESQKKSYGRYGRDWQSEAGNLYFSFLIKEEKDLRKLADLSFIIALAVKDALSKSIPEDVILEFKWPNDILLNGKKFCGILLENKLNKNTIDLICGVGINITSYPKELENFATSLKAVGVSDIAADILLFDILYKFEELYNLWLENPRKIYDDWIASAANLGQKIIVQNGKEKISGIFSGLKNGNIVLVDELSGEHIISTGDVFFSDEDANRAKVTVLNFKNKKES